VAAKLEYVQSRRERKLWVLHALLEPGLNKLGGHGTGRPGASAGLPKLRSTLDEDRRDRPVSSLPHL
jgi:hypothetical protein